MPMEDEKSVFDQWMLYCQRAEPSWLGRARGASEEELARVEALAPCPLPTEYREFLKRLGTTPPGTLGGFLAGHEFGVKAALRFYEDPPVPIPNDAVYFSTLNEDTEYFLGANPRGKHCPLLLLSWERKGGVYDLGSRAEFVVAHSLQQFLYQEATTRLWLPSFKFQAELREPYEPAKPKATFNIQNKVQVNALAEKLGFRQVPYTQSNPQCFERGDALLIFSAEERAQDIVRVATHDVKELTRISEIIADNLEFNRAT